MTNVNDEVGHALKTYVQDQLGIENCHPSFEEYSPDMNVIIDKIKERGVQKLFCGFARIPRLISDGGDVGCRGRADRLRDSNNNHFICFLSALLNPQNSMYFKSEENEYDLPDNHPVHFVSDSEVSNETYRPYITPSSGCSERHRVFGPFGLNSQITENPPHLSPDSMRLIQCMPSYRALEFGETLEAVMMHDFHDPSEDKITSLWEIDTINRSVKRLTNLWINMSLGHSYNGSEYLDDSEIIWNVNAHEDDSINADSVPF